jgi:hypothetical protein
MRQLRRLLLVVALCCAAVASAAGASVFDVLQTQREEQLYYHDDLLPAAVRNLIAGPLSVPAATTYFAQSQDDVLRFNLVLILGQKVRDGGLDPQERKAAVDFLAGCLKDGNPWIKTEAVFALGNAHAQGALPEIRRCLDDPNPTVVYHAALAIRAITGALPPFTSDQLARARLVDGLNSHDRNALADDELKRWQQVLVE